MVYSLSFAATTEYKERNRCTCNLGLFFFHYKVELKVCFYQSLNLRDISNTLSLSLTLAVKIIKLIGEAFSSIFFRLFC